MLRSCLTEALELSTIVALYAILIVVSTFSKWFEGEDAKESSWLTESHLDDGGLYRPGV